MKFEKTQTYKKEKTSITNNIETTQILRNGEKIRDYCILDITGNTVTIKQGGMITQRNKNEKDLQEIIETLTTKPTQQKKETKTSKATIKGTKKQTKKEKEETSEEK
jgi:hypothetical protein